MSTLIRKDNTVAVAKIEDAIVRGCIPGYDIDDPFLAALFWLVSDADLPIDEKNLFRALPHFPEVLAIEDLRNTLFNLGYKTDFVEVTASSWKESNFPQVVIDHKGRPYVRGSDSEPPMDPITAQPGPSSRRNFSYIMFLSNSVRTTSDSWVYEQIQNLRRDLVQLLLVKFMLMVLSLTIAMGVITVYGLVLPTGAVDTLIALSVGLSGVLLGDYLFRRAKAQVLAEIAERAEYALSTTLVNRVIEMPYELVVSATPAQQSMRLRQLMSAAVTFSGSALDLVLDLPFALFVLAVLAYFAPPLALVPLALAVTLLLMGLLAIPELRRREATASLAKSIASRAISEVIHDRRQVQADGRESEVLAQTTEAAREAAIAVQHHETLQRGLEAASSASGPLAGGLLAVFGAHLVMAGDISLGVLLGSVIMSWRILSPIQAGSQMFLRLSEMMERRRAIDAMMKIEAEESAQEDVIRRINGRSIAMDRLICRYPNTSEAALKGISAEIPQGAIVAVTGPSGAGKTTLLRSIIGLTPARGGQVLVGGLNTRQISINTLRSSVKYVPVRPHILHGTIEQNLRLGDPGASTKAIEAVCRDLGILDTVLALPDGFQTRVTTKTESGLPSGFLQSLSIARAILEAPDALLLDEPAVGMDSELEDGLLRTLEKGRGLHTILMVTHRPSHIRFCDYELKLDAGKLLSFEPTKATVQ